MIIRNLASSLARHAVAFALASLSFLNTSSSVAAELIRNGGFERPMTHELSQAFAPEQQHIPGWEFTSGSVRLVNHTRLLAGEGFQCLLLPCGTGDAPLLQQRFTVPEGGAARISLRLAASSAVDGEVAVRLNGVAVKTIRLTEFWKPEEIALTDQMLWRTVETPTAQLTAGEYTLAISVAGFEPRKSRQGDARDEIKGVLVDAVSVIIGSAPEATNGATTSEWSAESKPIGETTGPLPLDGIAGPWVSVRTLACYPSLANFYGALRSTKEIGSVQYLHFHGVGAADAVLNAIALDGEPVLSDESRWYPYQLRARSQAGPLEVETTTRMVFADHGVLTRFAFVNRSGEPVTRTLTMNLQAAQAPVRPEPGTVVVAGQPSRAYRFDPPPDEVVTTNGTTLAQWKISVAPRAIQEISLALAMEASLDHAISKAQRWGGDFAAAFDAAEADWSKRWQEVFTPRNPTYSGSLPILETDDKPLQELYYLSVASLLATERDNFPLFGKCYVAATPEWCRQNGYFWDLSLTSLPVALLNPEDLKKELKHWLTIDWKTCCNIDFSTGKPSAHWYAVNPYAWFLTFDRYLTVTGDSSFLSETINGKNVLDWLEALAMDWKRLTPAGGKLADIGGNCWSMLEAPPDYKHTVASLNAANVWMMRRLAEYRVQQGNAKRATELRAEADAMAQEVLKLYNPEIGSWFVQYPDGRKIDSRHVYDYLTVGNTISADLGPKISAEMIGFVERELMTKTWMRAMSRQDPSAFDSDRSDHGPAGSYSGWPAMAGQATAELGRFDKALDMFHRFRTAFDSAIPQAIELTTVEGQEGLQARVSTRAGASFAECSGSFADVIISTFFGFRPTPDGKSALWKANEPRGFNGKLRHVRWNGALHSIVSDERGLRMEKENP